MDKDPYNIVKRPLMTEKAHFDSRLRNAYHFEVAPEANKIEIKAALEKIYQHKGIKVLKVRTINKRSKRRRYRLRLGATRSWKKAIVFLDKEHRLELF